MLVVEGSVGLSRSRRMMAVVGMAMRLSDCWAKVVGYERIFWRMAA
jgi:hypothetical protein